MQDQTKSEERTSPWVIAKLFFGTYLVTFTLATILAFGPFGLFIILCAPQAFGILPNFLFSLSSINHNDVLFSMLGYATYTLVLSLAFTLRKPWQTCFLWGLWFALILFSLLGYREIASHETNYNIMSP